MVVLHLIQENNQCHGLQELLLLRLFTVLCFLLIIFNTGNNLSYANTLQLL